MVQDTLTTRLVYPCEYASPEELAAAVEQLSFDMSDADILRHRLYPIPAEQIALSQLCALSVLGDLYDKRSGPFPDAFLSSGSYISRDGSFLLLVRPQAPLLANILAACSEKLTHLSICHADLDHIPGLERLTGLTELHLLDCRHLTRLSGLENLSGLTDLHLFMCCILTEIPGLANLRQLISLRLDQCWSLPPLSGLAQLTQLTSLYISGSYLLTELPGLDKLTQLIELDLNCCKNLTALPDLCNLRQLRYLTLSNCELLTQLPGLGKLTGLTALNLSSCEHLIALPGLENLTQLTTLILSDCAYLTELPGLDKLAGLRHLDLRRCRSLTRLPGLDDLKNLVDFYVSGCYLLPEIPSLKNLGHLTLLDLSMCRSLVRLPDLAHMTKLAVLNLADCKSFTELPDLSNLKQLRKLILSGCHSLTKLPELDALPQLTELHLPGCSSLHSAVLSRCSKLTTLNLDRCVWLRYLDLSECRDLTTLELTACEALTTVILSGCEKITHLNASCRDGLQKLDVSGCKRLTHLDVYRCLRLTHLIGLADLKQLTFLDLQFCRSLTELPGLGSLIKLTELDLSGCRSLGALPGLENLTQLSRLYLSGLPIEIIPDSIREIKSLRNLALRELHLKDLPDWLPEIAEHFSRSAYAWKGGRRRVAINLFGTTVDGVDMSIFDQPHEIVRKWFEERKAGRTQPLNEIKVIFLGDGEAGKSFTISRLINNGGNPVDYEGIRTPGIAIKNHPCEFKGRKFKVNYWDFGGQEIMHSMHRVFLTNRTMYVVLVSATDPNPDARARYWLNNIRSFAPDAPILLALNKIDVAPYVTLDASTLLAENRRLTRVVRLSSLTFDREQFDREFRHILLEEIVKTDILDVQWPKAWIEVKNRMEGIGKYHIPVKDYKNICKACQVEDVQTELLHWFNDLGVSFCFRNDFKLKHQVILQPKWITNGLYIILFNKCQGVINGVVPHESIHELLENAPKDSSIQCTDRTAEYEIPRDAEYVLGIMRKFGLSYHADEDSEFIPMLCQDYPTLDVGQYERDENVLEFHMTYPYLPNNLLHRLMVERYEELDKSHVWKTGARFVLSGTGLSAIVAMNGNTLKIYISHENLKHPPKTYLTMLRVHVNRIRQQMGLPEPDEALVYKAGGKIGTFDYEEIKYAVSNGLSEMYSKSFKKSISFVELLSQSGLDDAVKWEQPPAVDRSSTAADEQLLMEYIVQSCRHIQADPVYGAAGDGSGKEDLRNRRIRDDLKLRLEKTGCRVSDQPQLGRSGTGNSIGELDMFLEDSQGNPWTIIEALRIQKSRQSTWNDHLTKLLGNYNCFGLKYAYLLTYVDTGEDDFSKIWEDYQGYIKTYHPGKYTCDPDSYEELDSNQDLQYIRRVRCDYTCGFARVTVYHLFVMIKPQPQKTDPNASIS